MIGDRAGDRAVEIHNGDQPIVIREPDHDMGGEWAWRYDTARCDQDCHHPMHAFGHDRGVGHLTWYRPGTPALVPAVGFNAEHDDPYCATHCSPGSRHSQCACRGCDHRPVTGGPA